MDWIMQELSRSMHQLLGRASGPLHFRLLIMPCVVTFLACRAGFRDARSGSTPFVRAIFSKVPERSQVIRSGLKDVGRIFIVAIVLDTTYQLIVLRKLYPLQVLIVAVACAVVPYMAIRGPVSLLARLLVQDASRSKPPVKSSQNLVSTSHETRPD
jgi:hypothetical protein